jgi:hypothetical protein
MTPSEAIVDELERILESGVRFSSHVVEMELDIDTWERLSYDTALKDNPNTFWTVRVGDYQFVFRLADEPLYRETIQ